MTMMKAVRGIAFAVLVFSAVLVVMADAPTITYDTQTPGNGTIAVDYINVSVTLGSAGGIAILNWNGVNDSSPMTGSGTSFYTNKTGLSNGSTNTFFVYANDSTPNNWSVSSTRTVTVSLSGSSGAPSLSYTPTSNNPSSTFGTTQNFTASSNQTVNFSWLIDGTQVQYTTSATSATYSNNTAGIGVYNVTVNINNSNGTASRSWTWNVTNSPGPDPVSGLTVAGRGTTWINWTWTNPTGGNFNYTIVKINSTFQENRTYSYYNYTSFGIGTSNTIYLQTVDTSGNINSTVRSNTNSTLNTPAGSNRVVSPASNLNVTYSQVTGEGNTTVSLSTTPSNAHSFSKVGTYYYDISFTGTPSGNITVELVYNPAGIYNENAVRLYHWNSTTSVWDDVTTSLFTDNNTVRGNVTSLSPFVPGVPPGPGISGYTPSNATVQTIGSASQNFTVTFNQTVNVTWLINGTNVSSNTSVNSSYYLNTTPSTGTWNITVVGENANGTTSFSWFWTVRSRTYETGNRVWDGSKEMNLTYTWNPMSFYAFYYDLDNNVGNESLRIFLDSRSDRNIQENSLQYSTVPENVSFKYKPFGFYNVVGFMAEKYFAAYTATTSSVITSSPISPMGSKQLHRILMDDDTSRAVYAGSTLTLSEGYVFKIRDVDITGGQIVLVQLLKDGSEVDTAAIRAGNTYVYSKKAGSISALPLIAVHIDTVFAGREANAAFLKGIFQISESFTSINTGNKYGVMEITSASDTGITMVNKNSFSLSPGTVNDIMGNIKIIVADNSTVLRFAPIVQKSGTYEVRGTIAQSTDTTNFDWNPLNFEGFYYDINEDVGSEKLIFTRSGRTIAEKALVYTTTPQSVSFKEKRFGSYNVIGFMASKYFAGYTASSNVTGGTVYNTISNRQLHRVLADDDTRRAVYAGAALTLNDGYVLKVRDVDITGGQIVLLQLLKDGNEVDTTAIRAGNTYIYSKRIGSVTDLPIIAANMETVFTGREANAVFVKGVFQISESFTSLNQGSRYGIMEVTEVSDTKIEMKNPSSVSLSQAGTVDVMGSIKFKVADSSDVRFYPFILVNGSIASANQLAIDAPSNPSVRDTIIITITAGGTPVPGATVNFDNNEIGTTNGTGKLNYTLTRSGVHNITATKLGYEKAAKTIQVAEFVENRLSIEVPAVIDQGFPVSIKVIANGSAIAGAAVTFDNTAIGTTDVNGILNYTFTVGGTHNLGASKDKYISVVREINIRLPFSEYKALDLSITPVIVFTNEEAVLRSNITNAGTKADEKPVELVLNGTVVENRTVALAPGETKEINFTRAEALPGNYTVAILGQKGLLEVREEPLNLLLIGGIATGFGAIIIYLLTSKSKISLEAVRRLLDKLGKKGIEKVTPPGEGKV